uniref:Disease resistance protein At4g27190-like leucine-rich repeats domain-containing protein n=1 Tax=Ananas comosus var. bracteatus TaxID=296719 RepID=A0A6V7PPW0_ANACO|nr:unnamed protein product [Ananas comosus var. bracteatus]
MGVASSSSYYEQLKDYVLRRLFDESIQKIYVEAWNGVGATALLREVAEAVETSEKREFETVIKVVQPALFGNPREIQRAVAKQLNLPPSVTAPLDAEDEDDDFKGKEFSSRYLLWQVADEIYQAVRDRSVLLVLCNNLVDAELSQPKQWPVSIIRRGSPNAVLWTSGMNISREAAPANADLILRIEPPDEEAAVYLVYKEAVEIARYIDESSGGSLQTTPLIVLWCFWDAAWEIGKALAPVIGPIAKYQLRYWQEAFSTWTPSASELLPPKTLLIDSITHGDWVKSSSSSEEESYRWILVCPPENNIPESWDFFKVCHSSVVSDVSSFFAHFEKTHEALPDGFFDYFSNVRVLDLLGCVVSPIDSSFLRLRNLRMLRLDRCKVPSLDPSHPSAPEGRREPILFNDLLVLNLYNSDADTFLLAGKAFELMPNLLELDLKEETSLLHLIALNELREHMHRLEVLKLSGNVNTNLLQRILSMAISLKELILNDCEGLEYLNFNLPATIETISLQRCASLKEVELVDPAAAPLPNLKTFHLSGSKLIAKLSLQGCRKLENVDLQELMGLEVLDLSCTAIKVVDISKLPQLKQLFLLGCEQLRRVVSLHERQKLDELYLDNYSSGSTCNVDRCLDSFRNQSLANFTDGISDANQRSFQAHVVVRDVRLFRSLGYAFPDLSISKARSHIHVKSSSTIKKGINVDTVAKLNTTITSALYYVDVLDRMIDHRRRHHPSPPAMPLNNHIEVDGGHDYRIVNENEFRRIMEFASSLFVHGNTSNLTMDIEFRDLKYFRIERCHNMKFIFPCWKAYDYLVELESIWLSELPRLIALFKGAKIKQLKHIYLEFCARLEYVFPSQSELHNLERINIRYCGNLTAIFIDDDDNEDQRGSAPKLLPNLKSIRLQELPKLQHIYKPNICAPSLEEIKIMGCFNLKKLPLFGRSDAHSMRAVKINCEKDWWDKLQWDGLESNHHSSLLNPKHCPYYKKRMKATYL